MPSDKRCTERLGRYRFLREGATETRIQSVLDSVLDSVLRTVLGTVFDFMLGMTA